MAGTFVRRFVVRRPSHPRLGLFIPVGAARTLDIARVHRKAASLVRVRRRSRRSDDAEVAHRMRIRAIMSEPRKHEGHEGKLDKGKSLKRGAHGARRGKTRCVFVSLFSVCSVFQPLLSVLSVFPSRPSRFDRQRLLSSRGPRALTRSRPAPRRPGPGSACARRRPGRA